MAAILIAVFLVEKQYYILYSIGINNMIIEKGIDMSIQAPTVLLDGTVLAILDVQDLYGYALTKKVKQHVKISESTMYPVLRRLEKGGEVETYSEPFEGRMRKYYQLTDDGRQHLTNIKRDWQDFSSGINAILGEHK
mgnify:CR=1 FL=1